MIEAYCRHFFGYGRWAAPVWFVGLEEAGSGVPPELHRRLQVWDQSGQRELEDAPAFYPACGINQWHGPNAKIQHTWRQLIRIWLIACGQSDSEASLLAHQQNAFGAASGGVCLTELSPLPAPNSGQWPYADHQDLPRWVQSRELFMQAVAAPRIATLRERVAEHQPKVVVFYFWKHREHAEALAGGKFQTVIPEKLLGLERDGTSYFIIGHPAGRYPDTYFSDLGRFFHEHYGGRFAPKTSSFTGGGHTTR